LVNGPSTLRCCAFTARGAGHAENEKPCQDFSKNISTCEYSIIAVSDGHGGDKYFRSAEGARFAAEAALECVAACLGEADEDGDKIFVRSLSSDKTSCNARDAMMNRLGESVILNWNNRVRASLEKNPFREDEIPNLDDETKNKLLEGDSEAGVKAYGTTLIAAAAGDGFWLGFQIGDGTFVIKNGGEYSQPIEPDELCAGNVTTSVCDAEAIKRFHFAFGFETPEAILIATDGLDESFASAAGWYKFYDNVLLNSRNDFNANAEELSQYLPELSKKGSRDDISLAFIINFAV